MNPPLTQVHSRRRHNLTRETISIPLSLLRRGKFYLLPLYYLAWTSDLAREGILNSGSYRFADHVYMDKASGILGVGTLLDRVFLSMKSARSFRNRFYLTKEQMLRLAGEYAIHQEGVHVLTVPAGIARDIIEVAAFMKSERPKLYSSTTFHGLDLDPDPLALARDLAREYGVEDVIHLHEGDALDINDYPKGMDIIVSAGLGEFLTDDLLAIFYGTVHDALEPGGTFVTTATAERKLADYFLVNLGELITHYRGQDTLQRIFRDLPYTQLSLSADSVGLQTLVVAKKADA